MIKEWLLKKTIAMRAKVKEIVMQLIARMP